MSLTPNRASFILVVLIVAVIGSRLFEAQFSKRRAAEEAYRTGVEYDNFYRHDVAERYYREAIEHDPNFVNPYSALCGLYSAESRYEEAIEVCNEGLIVDRNYARLYANLCMAQSKLGEFELAEENCQRAIKLDPKDSYMYSSQGWLYGELGQPEEAIVVFTQALELNEDSPSTYYNRGRSYYDIDELELALADFEQANTRRPREAAHYWYALTLFELERYTEALESLDEYFNIFDDDKARKNAYYLRGWLHIYEFDNPELALPDFEQALQLDAYYGNAYAGRGDSSYALGLYDLALPDYCRYVALVDYEPASTYFELIDELGECPE